MQAGEEQQCNAHSVSAAAGSTLQREWGTLRLPDSGLLEAHRSAMSVQELNLLKVPATVATVRTCRQQQMRSQSVTLSTACLCMAERS